MRQGYQKPVSELSGYKTLVTPNSEKNLPADTSKSKGQNYRDRPNVPSNDSYREQALPITPKHEERREKHQPQPDAPSRRPEYNSPPESGKGPDEKSLHKDRVRTKGQPGEEYGHPYIDNGPAGIKKRRTQGPTSAFKGKAFPGASEKQKEQRGQAKLYFHRYYLKNRPRALLRSNKYYRINKNKGGYKREMKRRDSFPVKYRRRPGGGAANLSDRGKTYRKKQKNTPENRKKQREQKTAQMLTKPILFLDWVTGQDGYLQSVDADTGRVQVEMDDVFRTLMFEDFLERVIVPDRDDSDLMFEYLDRLFEYNHNPLDQSRLAFKLRRRPVKRQRRRRGIEKLRSKRDYRKNRVRNKLRARKRYKKNKRNPQFKKQQKIRRKHPERFRRRRGGVLVAPEIAFVIGGAMDLGYVHDVSGMSGMVTFYRHRPGENDASLESMPVDLFVASVVFLSEQDMEAAFDLIEVEIGDVVWGELTPETLRASSKLMEVDCDSAEFKKLCEKLVGKSELEAMTPDELLDVDSKLVNKMVYDSTFPHDHDGEDLDPADQYMIDPHDDDYIYGQVNLPGDYEHLAGKVAARWLGASFYYDKPETHSTPDDNWYDRGMGWSKKKRQQDEREPTLEKNYPYGFVDNNPGSAKVIPEGHGFVNKSGREQFRTAVLIADVMGGTGAVIHERAQGLKPKLKRVDARHAMWTWHVPASKGGNYTVKVKAPRRGNIRNVAKLDVFVSCSCPFWQWQGPEHWAHERGYLYGKPRGTMSKPVVKDPNGENGACKHVLSVLDQLKDVGSVRKHWGKRGGFDTDFRYLADRLAKGETRVLSARRVAARYIGGLIQQAQRRP